MAAASPGRDFRGPSARKGRGLGALLRPSAQALRAVTPSHGHPAAGAGQSGDEDAGSAEAGGMNTRVKND